MKNSNRKMAPDLSRHQRTSGFRSSVQNLTASISEVADCRPTEYPSPLAHLQFGLVCPFWASVGTWQDYSSLCRWKRTLLRKQITQYFLVSCDCKLVKTYLLLFYSISANCTCKIMQTRPLNLYMYQCEILLDGYVTTSPSQQDTSDLTTMSVEFMDIQSCRKHPNTLSVVAESWHTGIKDDSEDKRVPVVKIFSPESSALLSGPQMRRE